MDQLTQTVEVRVFSNDNEMNRSMQDKLEAIYADILATDMVAEAFEVLASTNRKVARLKQVQANLTKQAADLSRGMTETSSQIETTLIESLAEGKHSPKVAPGLKLLAELEGEHKAILRLNSRILESLLPQAEIAETRSAADYFAVKAAALREAASARIKKTAQLMSQAAEHEGGIVFDSQNTLSGEMRRHADEFDKRANSYRESARELETRQAKLAKELESFHAARST